VPKEQDRYARPIADVHLADLFVNRKLVRRNLAWHYKNYSHHQRLPANELAAREQSLGLWAETYELIPPWDWRRMSQAERDQFR